MAKTALALIVIVPLTLGGCVDVKTREYSESRVETATVTDIALSGGAGSVTVKHGTDTGIRIERQIRYHGQKKPIARDRVDGTQLNLDTYCGSRCSVSYVVTVSTAVDVNGHLNSGRVDLELVGTVNLDLDSGSLTIHGTTGTVTARTRSGSIDVADAKGNVTATAQSGDIRIARSGGLVTGTTESGRVDVRETGGDSVTVGTGSGELAVTLTRPQVVHAQSRSGDIRITVPVGMNVNAHTDTRSGDSSVRVPIANDAATTLDLTTLSGDISVIAAT